MFFIEVAGLLIRHFVLAVRLFANMFAGHVVLSVILGFTVMAWSSMAFFAVMPFSVGGVVVLSLLELFVALLQAYVFTFLSAMFIGRRRIRTEAAGRSECCGACNERCAAVRIQRVLSGSFSLGGG